LRVFFQKIEGWLKLSSSPELYLQKTIPWHELLQFSCNAYQHYYHCDDQYINYLVHIAIFCTFDTTQLRIHLQNYTVSKHRRLQPEGAEWDAELVDGLKKTNSSCPCQEPNQNSSTISPQPSHYTDWALMAQSVNILHRKIYEPKNELW
jgi:hypothetical protein